MPKELDKIYNPEATERGIYELWLESGSFEAEPDPEKTPFTIVIPPPNVTGQLHMGHALDNTLQDILIRYKRMQGFSALWMPGTDHAGIATQIKVEESLRKEEGLTRYDLGREKFVERVWEWKKLYGDRIINQLHRLGASCDWRRERFTMDEGCSRAVREVFVSLYEKGLIYKGSRIINWCPDCTTALSDAEVEYEEKAGNFWHIKYPVKGSEEYVIIATTRPETMLGDTAVAVNPGDKRYAHLVGKTLILPLMDREIPVVADDYVEPDFGTGCVKITPSHDPNDFEVAARHNLPHVLVMDGKARINENGGKYQGMDRYEARRAIIDDLEKLGLLVKIEEHAHNVGTCYRCKTVVEPMTSSQWFVKMEPLAKEAIEVVKDGRVAFVPDRFSKIYTNWMENVHDWCISRQLWWGHRIPAYYCGDCGHITVSRDEVTACEKCGSKNVKQDEDVLDTWFSSALWPFSTLGWPDKTPELKYFYPTSVLVTGYDIIFFWVARMIFSGMEHMKREPFKKVFIHGIVRDNQGRKMSKSLGNGIDPLEIIGEYGADALRFTLVTGTSPGNDTRFYRERVEANRNFCNKIWNAARFVLMNMTVEDATLPQTLETEDKWILSKLNSLIAEVTDNLDKFELGVAAQKLLDFIWDSYCDWYIELTKPRLNGEDEEKKQSAQRVLLYVLGQTLKLLHPFMPFISEEIWQALPRGEELLVTAKWPDRTDALAFPAEEEAMESVMAVIRAVRNRRAEMNIPPSKKARLYIVAQDPGVFEAGRAFIEKLASASGVELIAAPPADAAAMVSVVTDAAQVFIPLSELIDYEKERARLNKEMAAARADLSKLEAKLSNEGFISKAPASVVDGEKAKAEKLRSAIEKIEQSLAALA